MLRVRVRARSVVLAAAAVCAILAPSFAMARATGAGLSIYGAVGAPATYSLAALRALPQTTARIERRGGHTVTGVSLEALVEAALPAYPAGAKNPILRVTVKISGAPTVTIALGELDPRFGNHPAILALDEDGAPLLLGPELVVPADTTDARTVWRVRRVSVSVQNPVAMTPPQAGALEVEHHERATVLSAALLASLPAQTLPVSFGGPHGIQHHTEIGPTLAAVLAAAGVQADPDTWVAAVGSDGYVASVTPAEAEVGGRPLLIATVEDGVALAQPRLITDGDVKGGRYDSDLVDLVVGDGDRGPSCALVLPGCRLPRTLRALTAPRPGFARPARGPFSRER